MKSKNEQMVDDILVTAVEGGINYWAEVRAYRWSDDGPTTVEVRDAEGGGDWLLVDRSVVRRGMSRIMGGEVELRSDICRQVWLAAKDPDEADVDAEVADCIVQAGLLGDVVYG